MSIRQKLNTKSLTEAELVGVDDVMPMVMWTKYFLKAQGYPVDTDIFQDNQSAMLLEKNRKRLSGKCTRRINIRCYFVTDQVAAGDVKIKCCPTDEMTGNCFTKPLQGSKFRKFRASTTLVPMTRCPRGGMLSSSCKLGRYRHLCTWMPW